MSSAVISPKKLIEVALPLDAINAAASREKSIRHAHPSTLHLWWARRPLAAARAVIFEDLVRWENITNETVLEKARGEIRKAWRESCELNKDHPQAKELFDPDKIPGLYDPFAGGGTIPLEAQRLGLTAYASDLNPV